LGLTDKEITVLRLRSQGLTQHAVADQLGISQAAVSSFETNAHKKLQDAQTMLAFAKHAGITAPPRPAYHIEVRT
jgi:transcriptional regulator